MSRGIRFRTGFGSLLFLGKRMNAERIGKYSVRIGSGALLFGMTLAFFVFFPVLREEARYALRDRSAAEPTVALSAAEGESGVVVPVDADFGIVIPKIGANAPVVADVDPLDADAYRAALSLGIAHARGTEYPGEPGNTFLFAHSSEDFLTRGRYDAVFYLLGKLERGDRFTVAYKGKLYAYRVFDRKILPSSASEYLNADSAESTVTLMTCWPPGTDAKRLFVFGVLESVPSE